MRINILLYGTYKLFFNFLMLSALPLLFMAGNASAQQTITIPLNNDQDRESPSPLGCQPAFNKTQIIYTSSEMGGTPGVISSVAFYVTSLNNPMPATPVVISMKNSTSTSLTSTNYQTANTGTKTVFTGVVLNSQLVANSWVVIPLTTPFSYAGKSLEVFIESDPGIPDLEDYTAKRFRWSDYTLQNVSQTWTDFSSSPGPTSFGQISTYRPNIRLALQPAISMSYVSSSTTQPKAISSKGAKTQLVAGIQIEMQGSASPLSLTDIDLNKLGSSLNPNAINNARVYYTGLNADFDTLNLFGGLGTAPTGPFTISGNKQLSTGTNYFWVTYTVDTAIAIGDSLDVQCTQLTISGTPQIPSITSPLGNILIGHAYTFESNTNQHFVANPLGNLPNQWQRGIPTVGPAKAFSGNTCWGTNLTGNITAGSNYALSTPLYSVTAAGVQISYKQWFHMIEAYAINSSLEFNINNGGWTPLNTLVSLTYEISSKGWEDAFFTVPTTIGDKIQFRWHLNADPNSPGVGGEGWYIDDLAIAGAVPFNQVYEVSYASPVLGTAISNSKTNGIIRVAIAVSGSENQLSVSNLVFNTAGSSPAAGLITNAKLYYTENRINFDTTHLYGMYTAPSGAFSISGSQSLTDGINYFWLTYDLSSSIQQNDSIDASCTQVTVSSVNYTPFNSSPGGNKFIGKRYDFDSAGLELFSGIPLDQKESEWQKGTPTIGPPAAYSGNTCWGTNLTSGYTPSSSYALHSPQFVAASPVVFIEYKQWYKLTGAYNIAAEFQYMINHSNSWTTLNTLPSNNSFINSANQWVPGSGGVGVNIGDTIEFRWAFTANVWAEADAGWYIDDVIVSGAKTFGQSFKDNAVNPVAGIASAGATNHAITRMEITITGNENPIAAQEFTLDLANSFPNTGLVSAAKVFYTGIRNGFDTLTQFGNTVLSPSGSFTITDSVQLQTGINYFWLAYNIAQTASLGDTLNGSCSQIKVNNTLFPIMTSTPSAGSLVGRLYHFDTLTNQGFEASVQANSSDKWQKGVPANVGPTSTPSGNTCWGTVINGNIKGGSHYTLQTPAYLAQGTSIETSYMQWYRLITAQDVDATFEYQVNNGSWNILTTLDQTTYFVNSNGKWQNALSQVSVAMGDTVKFRWNFNTESWVGAAPGWYIDNFLITGVSTFDQVYANTTVEQPSQILTSAKPNQAIMRVFVEAVGTENLQSVTSFDFNTLTSVVGAIDSAKLYYTGQNPVFNTNTPFGSAVASPSGAFTITGNQQLLQNDNYFWLTYDLNATAVPNDSFAASCNSVTLNTISHTPSVTSAPGSLYVGKLYDFDTTHNQLFAVVALGRNGNANLWQRGTPSNVGPAAAFSGNSCWATNLSGKYHSTSNYALLTVPYIAQSSTVLVGYKQWYELLSAYNINAEFQYQLNNNNNWTTIAKLSNDDVVNSNNTWQDVLTQPMLSAGDTVQFRWLFVVNSAPERDAAGWYIDDFKITGVSTFKQSLTNIAVEQPVDVTTANTSNLVMLRVPVTINGAENPILATDINFNTIGSDTTSGLISSARVYYTGLSSVFDSTRQYGATVIAPAGSFTFTDSLKLPSGVNYFWLTYNVGSTAAIGSVLDAQFEKITVSATDFFATTPSPTGNIMVGELYTFDAPYAQNFTSKLVSGTKNEWQRGTPVAGPLSTYSGTKCWGTNSAAGTYSRSSNYALVSPPYITTSSSVTTSFKQWYDIGSAWDVVAEYQYKVNAGSWNTLWVSSTAGERITSDNKWENIARQISVTSGDTIIFRWHFVTGMWGTLSTGWFIDNFIVSSVTKADVFAPTISYTPLNNTNVMTNRVLTDFATVNDESGITITPGNRPRIYYKKSSESAVFGTYPANNNASFNGWKYAEATNVSSPFSFTLNYSLLASPLSVNDTIEYFVVAQDASATAYTAAFPSENFTATSVNDILTSPSDRSSFIITPSPLSGVYNVGTGQVFTTLTSATSALTQRGVSGPVTFLLTDSVYNATSGEVFPITLSEIRGVSSVNTITFKPAPTKNITISSINAAFKLDDADYITIDGSNASTATRNLTLLGTGTTSVVWIGSGINGSHHNTIKNTTIKGGGNTKFGVYAGASNFTSISAASSAPNSYNTIENNSVQNVNIGIAFIGTSLMNADIGNKVSLNKIGDSLTAISGVGIFLQKQISDTVMGNTLEHIHATIKGIDVNDVIAGIYLFQVKQSIVSRNKVSNFVASPFNGGNFSGINVSGNGYPVTNNIISNNFIADGHAKSNNIYTLSGIDIGDGKGDKVYFNTVSLTGNLITTTGSVSAFHNGNASNIDIRNNIFSVDGSAPVSAIFYAHDTYMTYPGSTLDYNLLYSKASGSAIASIGRGYSTMAAWKNFTLKEAHSKTTSVRFVSATDLHLAGISLGDTANLKGTPISGFGFDIDGDSRNAAFPYMGADENTSNPLPVKLVNFTATLAQQDVLLHWTTSSEINNKGFYIERLTADKKWETITFIPAAAAKNTLNTYRFKDTDPFSTIGATTVYYRLNQMDFDGNTTYSPIVSVSVNHVTNTAVSVFPNPFQTNMLVSIDAETDKEAILSAYDIMGKKVLTQVYALQKGSNVINIEQSNTWKTGIYFVTLDMGNERKTIKVIKN